MAKSVQVVVKIGSVGLSKQIPAQVKLGWSLYGNPFELNGEVAQVMLKMTDASTEVVEYKTVMQDGSASMAAQVATLKTAGYSLYGSPLELWGQPVQVMIKGNMPIETGTGGGGGSAAIVAADITDATTVGRNVLKAVDGPAARTAIGAGTSNLVVGTTAATAKAGNYVPTSTEVGNALKAKAEIAALFTVPTEDAMDASTVITLANSNKAVINLLITALKA